MSIIELKDVHYGYNGKYGAVEVIKGINCSFDQGKAYAVIGKSGSGKSTLISLIAGLDMPGSGQVLFAGKPTAEMNLNKYRRDCVSVIYQNFCLFPLLTALENIMYPMMLRKEGRSRAREAARKLAARVSLPEAVLDRFPAKISGGEQQRVAIARALSTEGRLILADEPTGNLDGENSDKIMDILVRLAHEDNYCVIITTHDISVMQKVDKIFRIVDGAISVYQ